MFKTHNFSAGPCILPPEVLKEASEAVQSWGDNGLSLIEMSHRSTPFVAVMEEARMITKELLGLPDRFEILYLQGGASLGFLTSAYNLSKHRESRDINGNYSFLSGKSRLESIKGLQVLNTMTNKIEIL